MVPGTAVVAGPCSGVSLTSRVARARQNKWSLIRRKRKESIIGSPGVLHSINIVYFEMGRRTWSETGLINPMLHIIGHRLVRSIKDGWLVHVIPEAGDTIMNKVRIQRAPPFTDAVPGEIRKHGWSGPNLANVHTAVGLLHKMIACHPAVIRCVICIREMRDVQIGNGHYSKILFPQIFNHLCEMRELHLIDGERSIVILIINVQIERIRRNPVCTQAVCDLSHFGLRMVAVARLLKSKRPKRWQRRWSSQPCICRKHMLGIGPIKDVIVERPAFRTERVGIRILSAKIKTGSPRVVEQNSCSCTPARRQKERNALID